jgi:glycosyltransferase involved in cell wall biosynthesis
VLHTMASLKRSSGGTSRSVPRLCESLGSLGLETTLLSQSARWPVDCDIVPDPAIVRTEMVGAVNSPWLRLSYAPWFERRLAQLCAGADILHDHGLWLPSNHAAARVARRGAVPLIVSPRGMLDAWSLEYRSWKKRVAWQLYQRNDLAAARAFCATSLQEAASLRGLGFRQPVAVIANGVDLPPIDSLFRPHRPIRTALFMSRIHPKKGLLDLVRAWSSVRPSGWRLVIAGPDENGHRGTVESAVRAAGLAAQVQFSGPVEGEEKRRLMIEADMFVLPTLSENFGMVVAEALAFCLPVLTTRGAPWEDLVTHNCGWWVETGSGPVEAALRKAVELPDSERSAMGLRGRALVERKYAWSAIAASTREFYAWLLDAGPRPACIVD